MATLTLFNFNKKRNSTKQPTGGTSRTCALKESTSLENPTFILESYDSSWSYCQYMNRYYYIDDVVFSSNHLYELRCSTDVLATYKSEILKVDCNILYCDGSTKNIIDNRIPLLAGYTVKTNTTQFDKIAFSMNGGAIILGITGKGSFGSYILQYTSNISSLLDGVDDWTNAYFTDTLNAIKQLFFGGSASENLKSAIKLPLVFNPDDASSGNAEALTLGCYPCKTSSGDTIKGWHITKPIITDEKTISIPWTYSDWRRNSPYSEVILYLPCIGTISIPSGAILKEESIKIKYSINITSGDISAMYSGGTTGRIIGTASGNMAMATPYGSTGIDTTKLTTATVSGVGTMVAGITSMVARGGATTGAVLGMAGDMTASAMAGLSALGGSGSGSGGLGGGAITGLDTDIHCYVISRTLSAEQSAFNPIMGKPFMQVDTISNHKGFVMTEGFQVNIAGLGQDKDSINKLMDSGVYIE